MPWSPGKLSPEASLVGMPVSFADAMDIVEGQGRARMFHRQQMAKLIQHHGGQQHHHAGDHQAAAAGGVLLQVEVQIQQTHGEQRNDIKRAVIGDGDQMPGRWPDGG